MKVYFVRHGESVMTEGTFQTHDTLLSEVGQKQTDAVAKRFQRIPVDIIITSTYSRAIQTAKAIKKVMNSTLIESDLFIERVFPSALLGIDVKSPEGISALDMMREHSNEENWHHSDEENFYDLLNRVKKALKFIESQKHENVVVVTHGYFLVLLICHILHGDNITAKEFSYFKSHSSYSNTGLTMCEYSNDNWKLLTLNDYAHLGDN